MELKIALLVTLTLLNLPDHVSSQATKFSERVLPVDSNITLPGFSIKVGSWLFNTNLMVVFFPSGIMSDPYWENRTVLNQTTLELSINSLNVDDSGEYRLQEFRVTHVYVKLSVQVPISDVSFVANETSLVEFNDSVAFTCSVAAGSNLSFKWLKGNSTYAVTESGTLSIPSVTRDHKGLYRCNVSNGLGYEVSTPIELKISYGPSNPMVKMTPNIFMHISGSDITLSCSADSNPPATAQWMLNDTYLNKHGPTLQLENVTEGNSGSYKCVLYNSNTSRYNSAASVVRIMDPITAVVLSIVGRLAVLNEAFTLQCQVTGPVQTILWYKDNQLFSSGGTFSQNNQTLTINSVQRSDGARYHCLASSYVSNMSSNIFQVTVHYGPEMMNVTGPRWIKAGERATLGCQADSVPTSSFVWSFNSNVVANTPDFVTPPLTREQSGSYICRAINNITNKNSTANITLFVVDPIVNVTVRPGMLAAIKDAPYELMCDVTGDVDQIYWMKGMKPLATDNRTVLGVNNKTVKFMSVIHDDGGDYNCLAMNYFGNMTSYAYSLIVNYGPETSSVMGPGRAKAGNSVTLNCNAASYPPSSFSWRFNDSTVSNMSTFNIRTLTKENGGTYTCYAINSVTNKTSSSSLMLFVVDPIVDVTIRSGLAAAIKDQSHEITCDVTGDVDQISWMKGMDPFIGDNATFLLPGNRTIHFVSIDHNDAGEYHCNAVNEFGNMISVAYNLVVNYGPEIPTVTGPSMAKGGDGVKLTCEAESNPPSFFRWLFNDTIVSDMSTFAIPALTKEQSGEYTCVAVNNITNKNSTARITLHVIEKIAKVQIEPGMYPAVEGQSYSLTCDVTGPADHIFWMKNWEPLQTDNTTVLLMNNKTLTFMQVERSDAGEYECMAMNAMENMTSPAHSLNVNYGPENVTIMGPNVAKAGDTVVLKCWAESKPPSQFTLSYGGSEVPITSEYVTPPLTKNMSGEYTCVAFNNVTNITRTKPMMLSVVDPIRIVQIQMGMSPCIEGDSCTLTCDVTGPADNIYWMKNWEPLQENSTAIFLMNNSTLKFMAVERSDAGSYQCMAINAVANMTSQPYKLVVNYGPDSAMIQGPEYGETGRHVVLNCSAPSMPPCNFTWWFNGTEMAFTSDFIVGPLTFNMSGNYTCEAYNNMTGETRTASSSLTVIEAIESVRIQNSSTPMDQKNFSLTCDIVGPYDTFYWMKDNEYLNMTTPQGNQSMTNHTQNNHLHFTPLTIQDDGMYQCVAINRAGHHKSPEYMLLANYGPLSVNISGPDAGRLGSMVSLTCSADSRPVCNYQWFIYNKTLLQEAGPVLTFPVTLQAAGIYACVATNPVTKITKYENKIFTIGGQASLIHFATHGSLMSMSLLVVIVHVLLQ